MTFKITIAGKRTVDGVPTIEREVPALPRPGDYIGVDDHPECSGYVKSVQFWWPEGDKALVVEVQLSS